MKSVHIIGGGVVGLTLAKDLASRGIKTTVYESKRKVSDNAAKASGIFSKEGLAGMKVDWKNAQVNTMNGAVLHAGNENFTVNADETKAHILDRGIFAEICAKEASEAGANIVLNRRMTREEILKLKDDPKNIIVGADGAVSMTASAAGFPPIDDFVLTYKAEYENVLIKDTHAVGLFFSNKIAKRFFGWTVPYTKTKLEVGIGIDSKSKKTSTAAFEEFIATPHMKELLGGSQRVAGYASIIPLQFRKKTVIDNVLLVGDAAGQVKATTGGGIIFGVSCAKMAADAIESHIRSGTPLSNYEKEWRKKHELDLKLHKVIHGSYSSLSENKLAFAMRAAKLLGFDKFLGKYGDMDRPTLVLKRLILRNSVRNE